MELKDILEKLSPIERKVLPYLEESVEKIGEKSGLDATSVLRALEFLKTKEIVKIKEKTEKIVDLDVNGILYKKKGLPERRLLNLVADKKTIDLKDAEKQSGLNENEFKAALGALKKKALIQLANGKIMIEAKPEEIIKKTLEEQFLESLPLNLEELKPEQKFALDSLKKRKNIIITEEKKTITIEITSLGKKIMASSKDIDESKMLEKLTPGIIKDRSWRGKKFRRYDIISPLPKISGGKRHFVNQATDYARKIWTEMGFEEMSGSLIMSGFWNFDALYTPQDHPARELHDTFFIAGDSELPDKKTVQAVKQAHESGTEGSVGWQYSWKEEDAEKTLLRTHTTCLSAQTLVKLKEQSKDKDKIKGKFFSVGKCFRNETVDWSHGFEFNQTEGIVVDENANFANLLGYLKEFAKKMGFEKVRFRPHYFPYTEPSLEGDVWDEERKQWVEIFAAGIFRPEVTEPLLGKPIPVLAWGPGFDRMIMKLFGIKDMRDMYKNDLTQLRELKFLVK